MLQRAGAVTATGITQGQEHSTTVQGHQASHPNNYRVHRDVSVDRRQRNPKLDKLDGVQ